MQENKPANPVHRRFLGAVAHMSEAYGIPHLVEPLRFYHDQNSYAATPCTFVRYASGSSVVLHGTYLQPVPMGAALLLRRLQSEYPSPLAHPPLSSVFSTSNQLQLGASRGHL